MLSVLKLSSEYQPGLVAESRSILVLVNVSALEKHERGSRTDFLEDIASVLWLLLLYVP